MNAACGEATVVMIAGETCADEWVEFKLTLASKLHCYTAEWASYSECSAPSLDGHYFFYDAATLDSGETLDFAFSSTSDWWLLTQTGWGSNRCWEPRMTNVNDNAYDGYILDQNCGGMRNGQSLCHGDRYYVYHYNPSPCATDEALAIMAPVPSEAATDHRHQ